MRKINNILFIISVFLMVPYNVFACPHIDASGNAHLQIYSDDYTQMTMIYPKTNYLYNKEVYMSAKNSMLVAHEDYLLKETYSFPVYRDNAAFLTYYWFTEDTLSSTTPDELVESTTVEGVDSVNVLGKSYSIDVYLTNTYKECLNYINKFSTEAYYNLIVEDVSNEESNQLFNNIIKDNNIDIIGSPYLIQSEYMNTMYEDISYSTKYTKIDNYLDDIIFSVSSEYVGDAVAINLYKPINEVNYIEATYSDGVYSFNVEEEGAYILVPLSSDIVQQDLDTVIDTGDIDDKYQDLGTNSLDIDSNDSESNNNLTFVIGLVSVILVLLVSFVVVMKKFNKKS